MRVMPRFLVLAILFPLIAHSFEVAIKDGQNLFFEYGSRSFVYDLQAGEVVAQIDGLVSRAVFSDGKLYAEAGFSGTEIYSYAPPTYTEARYFQHEDTIAGFGFVEEYFVVGFLNGRVAVYEREGLQLLFEHSIEGSISDLVVAATGAIYMVEHSTPMASLRKYALHVEDDELLPQAQIYIFDDYIGLDAQEKIVKTYSGTILNSDDLTYIAGTEGRVYGAENFIITSNHCGYLRHELEGGRPKTYAATIDADYFFIDGDELVELHFQKIIDDPDYSPSRKSLDLFIEDEPVAHENALPIAEVIFPKVSSDETENFFVSGRDQLGSSVVGIWSVIEQSPIASFALSCGIKDSAYSYAEGKYYVYDSWGRVYEFDVHAPSEARYLTTAGSTNNYHYLMTNSDSIELQDHARAIFFDYKGDFRQFSAPTFVPIEEACTVPTFNRADCQRHADVQHIPTEQRSVVAWVGDQLVTLSEDYILRFWNAVGAVQQTYSAPYHRIMTMGQHLVLLRFDPAETATLTVDPSNLPDSDSDGVNDLADNCLIDANQSQADMDLDGAGDACDEDLDGDYLPNHIETAVGLDPYLTSDGSGDLDGDGFSNLIEYAFGSAIDSASGRPIPESSYSETFENGWPRRFFSGGNYPWSLSSNGDHTGVLRGPNGGFFSGESSVFFYVYAERSLAVSFHARGRPEVRVNGVTSSGVSMSQVLEGGWVMVTVVVGDGVYKIEIVDKAYSSPPIVGASFHEYIDNVHAGIDRDLDGIADEFDLCPLTPVDISAVGGNYDGDGDGMAHACDTNDDYFDVLIDSDGDGYFTHADSCPDVYNPDQLDNDVDLMGDVCDEDDDNDGYSDELELLHGSSTTEKEALLSLDAYFPARLGKFIYKGSDGSTQSQEIVRLSNGQYRSIDAEGFFTQYGIGESGLFITAIGDRSDSLDLGTFEYLPHHWQLVPNYTFSSNATLVPLKNEVRLLDFHVVQYNGEAYSAVTFEFTQSFDNDVFVTTETYVKGIGLYKTDDYVLIELAEPQVAVPSNQRGKKKSGFVEEGFLLIFLVILFGRLRLRAKLADSFER